MPAGGNKVVDRVGWVSLFGALAAVIGAGAALWAGDSGGIVPHLMTLASVMASVGVGFVVATSIARSIAMETRRVQLVDELVHLVRDAACALVEEGWKRLDSDSKGPFHAATRAAARLTKAVSLARKSNMKKEAVASIERSALRIKKLITDTEISDHGMQEAEEIEGDIRRRLLGAQFHALEG